MLLLPGLPCNPSEVRALIAGLVVVAALGVGLWLLIVRDDNAKAVPQARAATKTEEAPAPTTSEVPARNVESVGAEIRKSIDKSMEAKRMRDERAPVLPVEDTGSGSGSAKIATPEDHLRWAMMRAVHSIEPAVVDCINDAKNKGETFGDAIASYGFFFTKKGDEMVHDGNSLEYGPFSASVNTCIQNAGKVMAAAIERIPEGATRLRLYSKITLEGGEVRNVQMPQFRVESN